MNIDWNTTRITVTGGAGFLGSYVCNVLRQRGCRHLSVPRRCDYDLTREDDVVRMYDDFRPEVVIHLAAEVGGIGANRERPGRFFYANMAMGLHLIEHARLSGVGRFVHAGTVCAYPKFAPVPFREDAIWDGYPEETNAPYGVAKKSLFVMLDAYRQQYDLKSAVVVPVNLYGPRDNFDPDSSHVIPALIRRFDQAKRDGAEEVTCWGTGTASREFLFAADAATGIVRAAASIDDPDPINLGSGQEITIEALATRIAELIGYGGEIVWNHNQPDGQPRRCLDVTRATELLSWQAQTPLDSGLQQTIRWWQMRNAALSAA